LIFRLIEYAKSSHQVKRLWLRSMPPATRDGFAH
jgi:hypothetical protein